MKFLALFAVISALIALIHNDYEIALLLVIYSHSCMNTSYLDELKGK